MYSASGCVGQGVASATASGGSAVKTTCVAQRPSAITAALRDHRVQPVDDVVGAPRPIVRIDLQQRHPERLQAGR